jgi:hypothetical protein
MSSTLFEATELGSENENETYAERLRRNTVGMKYQETALGVTRKLSKAQIERIARLFGADASYLSGSKKLLNTRHPIYSAVTTTLSQAKSIWKDNTYPFPQSIGERRFTSKGMRILPIRKLAWIEEQLAAKKAELLVNVETLARHWGEICEQSEAALNDLHMRVEYPSTIDGLFGIDWELCSVEPPRWMAEMHPDLYAREEARIKGRFDTAIDMHEQAMASELSALVVAMIEKMKPDENGEVKMFRTPNMTTMEKFFQGFRDMNIGSNRELEAAVTRAEEALSGVTPKALNSDSTVRDAVREAMETVAGNLDAMIVERPQRRIRLTEEPLQGEEVQADDSVESATTSTSTGEAE